MSKYYIIRYDTLVIGIVRDEHSMKKIIEPHPSDMITVEEVTQKLGYLNLLALIDEDKVDESVLKEEK